MKWHNLKELDEKQLEKMLRIADEQDWLEFKREWKLFKSDGRPADRARDEFIKDILGLANGNSQTIRKKKYLIIGVDNKEFDGTGERVRYSVDYRVPTQSEIAKWLKDACTPAVVGIECEKVTYKGDCLFLLGIPPTFDLHETARELVASGGTFQKNTVFMRQDEHTVQACVRDGVTIQTLKHLHRQEIANPSSVWIGTLVGGVVGLIIGQAKLRAIDIYLPYQEQLILGIMVVLGVFFGSLIGIIARWLNEIRYDWHYVTWKRRIFALLFIVLVFVVYVFISQG